VTDDISPATLVHEGGLSRVVREAIAQGLSPITAYQMVTINAAQLLEKSRWIGTISPGRAADILILSDLIRVKIDEVYCDGVLVAQNGNLTVDIERYDYPDWAIKSVHVKPLEAKDFRIPCEVDSAKVRVMRAFPVKVHTQEEVHEIKTVDGSLAADPSRDLAKVAVFYRHEPRGDATGTRGFGFVTGLTLKPRVAFGTTVAHDCHNIMVIGADDRDMAMAANELIKVGGGQVVVIDGRMRALLPLPLAGLMSLEAADVVADQLHKVEAAIHEAGCTAPSAEMTISLLSLIVLPELHLSNRGYVQLLPGQPPRFVDLLVN
jgi:adenine deaminase